VANRGIFQNMNTTNNNTLVLNSLPDASQYNPCVASNAQQVIAATGTIDMEELVLTTQSSTANGIIIGASSVNFPSTNAPTSGQALLASNDSSNKIPTTSWVQSAIAATGYVYSVRYTTDQAVTTPINCRSIDLLVMGAGGAAGILTIDGGTTYYGGSGSGGNTIAANGIPMGELEELQLTFSLTSGTGSSTITHNAVVLARAFNGNAGVNGIIGSNASGGASNTTIGVGDTSVASWYNTFGLAGVSSNTNGTGFPIMATGGGTPKGTTIWANSAAGTGQRTSASGQVQGGGYVLITYHIGA
jgi:hypothetical protein